MKKNKINAVIILSLFAFMMIGNSSFAQIASKSDATYKKVTYSVDVHCTSCKEKIGKAMAYEKGVKECVVDVDKKLVTITYNPKKTSVETIKESLTKLGYKAVLAATKSGCKESHRCPKSSSCKK